MIPALLLVLLAVVYRIATAIIVQGGGSAWLSNFAPLAAIALCGAIYFPRKYKFTVPVAALLTAEEMPSGSSASRFSRVSSVATSSW